MGEIRSDRSWSRWILLAGAAVVAGDTHASVAPPRSDARSPRLPAAEAERPAVALSRLGVGFVENAARWDDAVACRASCPGYELVLTDAAAVLWFDRDEPITWAWPRIAETELAGERPGRVNYLIGGDATKWTRGMRHFDAATQRGAGDGVDLEWRLEREGARFDVRVAPGVALEQLAFTLSGARSVSVDADGALRVATRRGELCATAPVAWEEDGATRVPVEARWTSHGDGRVGFATGSRDPSRTLVIDPTLIYATAFGGSGAGIEYIGFASGNCLALGPGDSAFVVGRTPAADFPATAGAYATTLSGGTDGFVVKLDAAGALVYATHIGGASPYPDAAESVTVDALGSAYIAGVAQAGFPTTAGAFDTTHSDTDGAGRSDAFAAKLGPAGDSLAWSTYLGGDGVDTAAAIVLGGGAGGVYVSGFTFSSDFPRVGSIKTEIDPAGDAFVVKLAADGASVGFATVFGGTGSDAASQIFVDDAGAVYVAGNSASADLPATPGVLQPSAGAAPAHDPYAGKLLPDGTAFSWLTFVGGGSSGLELFQGMTVDGSGRVVLAGRTPAGSSFPVTTPGVAQPTRGGGEDLFVVRLAADASALEFATFLGGSGLDGAVPGGTVAVDDAGAIYVSGATASLDFPVSGGMQGTYGGGGLDAFVTKLAPDATAIEWSTYFGGPGTDYGGSLAVDLAGNVTLAGVTNSTDFPATRTAGTRGGFYDAFVAKVSPLPSAGGGEPPTLDLVVTKGKLSNSGAPGRDKFKAKGTLAFNAESPDGRFELAVDSLALVLGGGGGTVSFAAPGGGPGWKANRKGKLEWKTARGVVPKAVLTLDPVKGTFAVKAAAFDFGAAPGNPVAVDLVVGNDDGRAAAVWTEKRRGLLKLP